jgi:hypothetical protein
MRRHSFYWLVFMLCGCPDSQSSDGGTGPAVSYARINLSGAPAASVSVPSQPRTTICRAISASGTIRRDSDAGLVANDVMGDDFVNLAMGAHLAVKNGTTTREALFDGPADIRTCVGGNEEMWMSFGTFKSVLGAGETPGAEVWLVMPEGVVRYGSGAQLTVTATPSRADIKLMSGNAFAFEADAGSMHDAGTDGWYAIPLGVPVTLMAKQSGGQIVGICEQAAKAARDLAISIGTQDASLAEAAPKHVMLRQKAHAICAVAELVASRSLDLVERERLLPRARTANAKWRDSSP